MTTHTKRATAALAGAVALAFAGFAIGSQSGDGSAVAREPARSGAPTTAFPITIAASRERHGDRGLDALAQRLGVDATKLRTALDDVRDELPRPERRRVDLDARLASELGISEDRVASALRAQRPERPSAAERDRIHAAVADALAKELGLEQARVRAAFAKAHGKRRGPDEMEATLASELGVSAERIRAAFGAIKPAALRGRGPFGADLAALAKAMGVEKAELEAAFEGLRAEHEAEHERREAAFAEALAAKLGIERGKVAAALQDGGPFRGPGRHGGPGFGGPRGPR